MVLLLSRISWTSVRICTHFGCCTLALRHLERLKVVIIRHAVRHVVGNKVTEISLAILL